MPYDDRNRYGAGYPETLEATLQQFEAEMRRWGIRGVRSYAYVNGRYKADCLNTVKSILTWALRWKKASTRSRMKAAA